MKICNQCGRSVEDGSNFCPYCKSTSFRAKGEVTSPSSGDGSLIHSLFYWNYNGSYILSKTKVATAIVVLVILLSAIGGSGGPGIMVLALIMGIVTYSAGFVMHKITAGRIKSPEVLKYNDYGLATDLKHLFFYWQNKQTGAFALSKTKLISLVIFLAFAILAIGTGITTLAVIVMIGLIFEVPAFLIGFGIHKITNSNPEGEIIPKRVEQKPKPQIKKREAPKVVPRVVPKVGVSQKYGGYRAQVEELKGDFDLKDAHVRELIEKRFEPPQITYTRFITIVDKSKQLFYREYESIVNMIELGDENSPRIDAEIKSRMEVLRSIIQKNDDLTNELVLTMDTSEDDEVNNLIDDMEDLIKSVKTYK